MTDRKAASKGGHQRKRKAHHKFQSSPGYHHPVGNRHMRAIKQAQGSRTWIPLPGCS